MPATVACNNTAYTTQHNPLEMLTMPSKYSIHHTAHTSGVVDHAIKVFDVAKAVTAQLQGVGGGAQAIVHDIKGAFVLEGGAGVPIGHYDLHHGPSMHDGPDAATILIPAPHTNPNPKQKR